MSTATRNTPCPWWCTWDHDGPIYTEPGEHHRTMARTDHEDEVSIGTGHDDGMSVAIALLNGDAYFPLVEGSSARLRAVAAMLTAAADALDALDLSGARLGL